MPADQRQGADRGTRRETSATAGTGDCGAASPAKYRRGSPHYRRRGANPAPVAGGAGFRFEVRPRGLRRLRIRNDACAAAMRRRGGGDQKYLDRFRGRRRDAPQGSKCGPPRISEYSGTLRNSFWSHTIVTESTGVIVDTDVNPGAGLHTTRRRFDKPGLMLPVHRLDLLPSFPQYLLLRE